MSLMMRTARTLLVRLTILLVAVTSLVSTATSTQSSITAGGTFSMIVKPDGSVSAFGSNSFGQIGDTNLVTATWPVEVNGLSGIQSVVGGLWYSLALTTGGNVYARGHN